MEFLKDYDPHLGAGLFYAESSNLNPDEIPDRWPG
jgi:hypothetical protein